MTAPPDRLELPIAGEDHRGSPFFATTWGGVLRGLYGNVYDLEATPTDLRETRHRIAMETVTVFQGLLCERATSELGWDPDRERGEVLAALWRRPETPVGPIAWRWPGAPAPRLLLVEDALGGREEPRHPRVRVLRWRTAEALVGSLAEAGLAAGLHSMAGRSAHR